MEAPLSCSCLGHRYPALQAIIKLGTKQLAQQDSRLTRAPKARWKNDREGWEYILLIRMYILLLRAIVIAQTTLGSRREYKVRQLEE